MNFESSFSSSSLAKIKKRTPLTNITNHISSRNSSTTLVTCATKVSKAKKVPPPSTTTISGNKLLLSNIVVFPMTTFLPQRDEDSAKVATVTVPLVSFSSMDSSPTKSDVMSVSTDDSISYNHSLKSHDIDSIDRKTFTNLNMSDTTKSEENTCSRDTLVELEKDDRIVNVDNNYKDPQLCATFACDIYKHLRASEVKKRPSSNFMEKIQKDLKPGMRAILIDWLVEVAEEYRLVPDTLYLTVNYIDRYLSANVMSRQRLQLLGVASMMVASKYEEICAPQVEEFCYITDNTYFKDEVLEMESSILNFLKFEMSAPTIKCFLRRFIRAAQGVSEAPSPQLECLTNYIAELSLLEYDMLRYAPSLIAASAIFLAKFILFPSMNPWNSTLQHYTLYHPFDLCDCVRDLHRLFCGSPNSDLLAIKEKYNHHKHKYVSKNYYCPPSIPSEYFQN